MNIVLLVIDSLRARSLRRTDPSNPATPFLDSLPARCVHFRRAYASECWTLPTHASMFTGLLPSEHGAHFHTMAYRRRSPTIAEILGAAGWHTEIVARNFVFDGTIPGLTRGFQKSTRILARTPIYSPVETLIALAKPRFRRHLRETGFFHIGHRASRTFISTFARTLSPADDLALEYVIERCAALRRDGQPHFMFCNLYDVHAPYPPTPRSVLRSCRSLADVWENARLPHVMSQLGAHRYLKPGFRLPSADQMMLRSRYHRAIELMDAKLERFFDAATSLGLLEDTMIVITSDHGEGFGEHGLYLHDASVYDTHLGVPLWIHHPDRESEVIDDVVTTRDLFSLMRAVGLDNALTDTILDPQYRSRVPVAVAEHFYYPHVPDAQPKYRQNLAAAMTRSTKVIARQEGLFKYDLESDPDEEAPTPISRAEVGAVYRREGVPAETTRTTLEQLARVVVGASTAAA